METNDEKLDRLLKILIELDGGYATKFTQMSVEDKFGGGNILSDNLFLMFENRKFIYRSNLDSRNPYIEVSREAIKFYENGGFEQEAKDKKLQRKANDVTLKNYNLTKRVIILTIVSVLLSIISLIFFIIHH